MKALIGLAVLLAQDKVYSGPQKGEKTPGFKVVDVNGEHKGKEVDYVGEFAGAPTLLIFIHELTRPAAQLFRKLDEHAANRKGLRWLIVLLTEDMNKTERYAPIMQGSIKLKGTIGISTDGKEGPGSYGLNKDVSLTIVLAKDNLVVGNWAILSPNETDAPKITQAIDDLLGVKQDETKTMEAPKGDLEARVAALEREIKELRALVEKLQPKPVERPARKPAGGPPKDAKLNGLIRKLIGLDRSNDEVDATLKEIQDHVKDNDGLKKEAVEGLKLILDLKYGTEYAQTKSKEALGELSK